VASSDWEVVTVYLNEIKFIYFRDKQEDYHKRQPHLQIWIKALFGISPLMLHTDL